MGLSARLCRWALAASTGEADQHTLEGEVTSQCPEEHSTPFPTAHFLAGFGVAVSLAVFVNAVSKMRRPASMITFQDLATHWMRESARPENETIKPSLRMCAHDLTRVIETGRLPYGHFSGPISPPRAHSTPFERIPADPGATGPSANGLQEPPPADPRTTGSGTGS